MKLKIWFILGVVFVFLLGMLIIVDLLCIITPDLIKDILSIDNEGAYSPRDAVIKAFDGNDRIAETIGMIELNNSVIYIWKCKENTVWFDFIIVNNKRYDDIECFALNVSELYDLGWTIFGGKVAMNITQPNIPKAEYEGNAAEFKDFDVMVEGAVYPFRVFYKDLRNYSKDEVINSEPFIDSKDIEFSGLDFVIFAVEIILFTLLVIYLVRSKKASS